MVKALTINNLHHLVEKANNSQLLTEPDSGTENKIAGLRTSDYVRGFFYAFIPMRPGQVIVQTTIT